jgi:hypothetical protein
VVTVAIFPSANEGFGNKPYRQNLLDSALKWLKCLRSLHFLSTIRRDCPCVSDKFDHRRCESIADGPNQRHPQDSAWRRIKPSKSVDGPMSPICHDDAPAL